jgi:hypothetical protein
MYTIRKAKALKLVGCLLAVATLGFVEAVGSASADSRAAKGAAAAASAANSAANSNIGTTNGNKEDPNKALEEALKDDSEPPPPRLLTEEQIWELPKEERQAYYRSLAREILNDPKTTPLEKAKAEELYRDNDPEYLARLKTEDREQKVARLNAEYEQIKGLLRRNPNWKPSPDELKSLRSFLNGSQQELNIAEMELAFANDSKEGEIIAGRARPFQQDIFSLKEKLAKLDDGRDTGTGVDIRLQPGETEREALLRRKETAERRLKEQEDIYKRWLNLPGERDRVLIPRWEKREKEQEDLLSKFRTK